MSDPAGQVDASGLPARIEFGEFYRNEPADHYFFGIRMAYATK